VHVMRTGFTYHHLLAEARQHLAKTCAATAHTGPPYRRRRPGRAPAAGAAGAPRPAPLPNKPIASAFEAAESELFRCRPLRHGRTRPAGHHPG
jgi:hypothetical protein